MLLMSVPHFVHQDPVLWAKGAGVLATLGLGFVVFRFTRMLMRARAVPSAILAASVAVGFLLTSPVTAVHAVSGMETMLFACLLTWFLERTTRLALQPSRKEAILCGHAGLLAALTRPEANIAVVVALFMLLIGGPIKVGAYLRIFLLTYAIPVGLYWL